MEVQTAYRYEQLADLVAEMVANGALAPGARAPSVRAVSQQHGVSVSTVLQAYRTLEDRGILVARPQSGFYVAVAPRAARAIPFRIGLSGHRHGSSRQPFAFARLVCVVRMLRRNSGERASTRAR